VAIDLRRKIHLVCQVGAGSGRAEDALAGPVVGGSGGLETSLTTVFSRRDAKRKKEEFPASWNCCQGLFPICVFLEASMWKQGIMQR